MRISFNLKYGYVSLYEILYDLNLPLSEVNSVRYKDIMGYQILQRGINYS
jgi:hypothetical protein